MCKNTEVLINLIVYVTRYLSLHKFVHMRAWKCHYMRENVRYTDFCKSLADLESTSPSYGADITVVCNVDLVRGQF